MIDVFENLAAQFDENPLDLLAQGMAIGREMYRARTAIVRLADDGDTRLSTVIEAQLDLTQLAHESEFEIPPRERTWW